MVNFSNGSQTSPAIGGRYGDPRPNNRIHEGTDYTGFDVIHAIIDGVVTWVGYFNGLAGHAVVYEGRDPQTGDVVEVRHFHMAPDTARVRKGQTIRAGQQIGNVGKSGNATGKCDHVEVRRGRGGVTFNSHDWITSRIEYRPPAPAAPVDWNAGAVPGVLGPNPFGIPYTGGLQKVANLYLPHGGFNDTKLDQNFGPTSMHGFSQFLRRNWGYVGDDTLGPVMWRAIAAWLRAKYGYVGNDIPGPIMRAALLRADTKNWAEL